MMSEFFYRTIALLLTVGTLSEIKRQEKSNQELSEKYSKMMVDDHKVEKATSHHVVCYYKVEQNESHRLQPEDIPADICTHLIIGFADVRYDLLVPRTVYDLEGFNRTVALKARYGNMKVMLSVGARSGGRFSKMAATHLGRERFIYSMLYFLDKYHFDGIDFDWEFPSWNGANPLDRMNFIYLLNELRHVSEKTKQHYLVSAAVAAHVAIIDTSYDIPELAKVVDFVNIMSYDFRMYNKDWPFTAHHSPLFSRNSDKRNNYYVNVAWAAYFWEARGMPRSKLMVGIPTHARTYRLSYPQVYKLDSPASGPGLGNGKLPFYKVCDFLKSGAHQVFDIATKVPYAVLGRDWIAFDNEYSVTFKSKWVKEEGFGGVMTFNLNNDDWKGHCDNSTRFPLHKAIAKAMLY